MSDVTPHIYSEKAIRLFNKVWSYVYFDSLHILYGKNAISDRISESSEVICDPYLFSFIMKVYADLGPSGRRKALYVIVGIWILGSIIAFLRKNREWNKVKGYLMKGASKGDGVAERILERIDPECPITIEYNLAIAEPFIRGLRHPVIYLPEKECNEKELEFILMHEYLHWKRKDLWKKFIINIIGMIFWWNPLAYLLCKDLDQIIELNCDNAMSKKYVRWIPCIIWIP